MRTFLDSNKTVWRLLRTIVQGVLAIIVANLDMIIGETSIPIEYKPAMIALIMAILSPIMALFSDNDKPVEVIGAGEYEATETEYEISGGDDNE